MTYQAMARTLRDHIPDIDRRVDCPEDVECERRTVWDMVIHLNDTEGWKRERIAKWLDGLGLDLTVQPSRIRTTPNPAKKVLPLVSAQEQDMILTFLQHSEHIASAQLQHDPPAQAEIIKAADGTALMVYAPGPVYRLLVRFKDGEDLVLPLGDDDTVMGALIKAEELYLQRQAELLVLREKLVQEIGAKHGSPPLFLLDDPPPFDPAKVLAEMKVEVKPLPTGLGEGTLTTSSIDINPDYFDGEADGDASLSPFIKGFSFSPAPNCPDDHTTQEES